MLSMHAGSAAHAAGNAQSAPMMSSLSKIMRCNFSNCVYPDGKVPCIYMQLRQMGGQKYIKVQG